MTPKVSAAAESPILCTINGVSKINVLNPHSTSIYTWSTLDGTILGKMDTTSIYVNSPGTYIVTQQLLSGCGSYAADTVTVIYDSTCTVLNVKDIRLKGAIEEGVASLNWTSAINARTKFYEVQRSVDGKGYETIGVLKNNYPNAGQKSYTYRDETLPQEGREVSYRIRAVMYIGEFISSPLLLPLPFSMKLSVYPNPASQKVNISILSEKQQNVEVAIVNASGKTVYAHDLYVRQGENVFTLDNITAWTPGVYIVRVSSAFGAKWQKLIIQNSKL
jgi:hypothetical protein